MTTEKSKRVLDPITHVCLRGHTGRYVQRRTGRHGRQTLTWGCQLCQIEKNEERRYALRSRIVEAYGSQCVCCGGTISLFLCIDHVNGGGKAHSREIGTHTGMLRSIEKAGYPPDYRLLCWNCNSGVTRPGGCPHHRDPGFVLPDATGPHQRYRRKLRNDILDAYGSKCVCCAETERDFLVLDHIGGGGTKHRTTSGIFAVYRQVRDAGYPVNEYRLLCCNCNFGSSRPGGCPHQAAE